MLYQDLLLRLPSWAPLAPASPHHNKILPESSDVSHAALLTGPKHGICLLDVTLTTQALEATGLILQNAQPFAYVQDDTNVTRALFIAPPVDVKSFELQDQDGKSLFRFHNSEPFFFEHTPWQFTDLQHYDGLAPMPSFLLSGLTSALIQEGVALKPTLSDDETVVSDEAHRIRQRLKAEKLTTPVVKGSLPLQAAIEQLEDPSFLFELIFDRIDRHNVRLPLNYDEGLTHPTPFTDQHRVWGYDKLYQYTRDKISQHLDDIATMTIAVREVLEHMANAEIDTIQESLLLKFLVTQSGLDVSVTHFKRQLNSLKQSDRFQTHSDVAVDLFDRMNLVTQYRYHDTKFWQWAGSHWVVLSDSAILARISEDYGHLPSVRKAGDHHGIKSVLAGKLTEALKNDAQEGINLSNGFLDTELTLHPHHPDFGQTHTLPCAYTPDNTHMPLFWKFLHDTWGCDDDYQAKVDALQEMIAVTLFGMSRLYQRAFLLYGVPKSGKTQLLNLISYLVPREGKCSVGPEDWHDRFRPAQMSNKILNVVGELSERKSIDGQKFKDIVDGTEQMSEFKGRDHFNFIPRCAHWFASNHLPKTRDTSEGFNRRWLILSFNQPVPQGEQLVRDLGLKIAQTEREAIVAWAASAIGRVLERSDYTLPPSHFETVAHMASQNNSLAFFMFGSGRMKLVDPSLATRRLTMNEKKDWLSSRDYLLGDTLYHVYSAWCLEMAGVRAVSSAKFHTQMREMAATQGFIQNRIRYANGLEGYAYWNLELISQAPSSSEPICAPTTITEKYGATWNGERS